MTTIFPKDAECAMCGTISEQFVIGSTNQFGAPDLDLRPPQMARSTLKLWLQECPSCGYVASSLEDKSSAASALFKSNPWRALSTDARSLPNRFLKRSLIDEAEGELLDAGENALRAAWAADDQGDFAAAKDCRTRAASLFGRALGARTLSSGDRSTIHLRLIDVSRRAGDWERARSLCAALADDADAMVRAIVAFQSGLIETRDGRCYTIAAAKQQA